MVNKEVLGVIFIVFVAIGLIHLVLHIFFFGTGISGFAERGISGFSVQPSEENGEVPVSNSKISLIFVILEWVFVGALFFLLITKNKAVTNMEVENLRKLSFDSPTKTDIDRVYELLKKNKRLKISTIAKAFDVEQELVLEWGETLELGNLAFVNYPRIGEPEIVLNEDLANKK